MSMAKYERVLENSQEKKTQSYIYYYWMALSGGSRMLEHYV